MKLNFALPEKLMQHLSPSGGEEVIYCLPCDLDDDGNYQKSWYVAVTGKRLALLAPAGVLREYPIRDITDLRCDTMTGGGVLRAETAQGSQFVARFSMKYITRYAYLARGGLLLARGEPGRVESRERERVCEKCGRVMPGTNQCPRCNGKMAGFRRFWRLCKPFSLSLAVVSLFMLAGSGASLLIQYVQRLFIDDVLKPKTGTPGQVGAFFGVMLALTLSIIILNVIRYYYSVKLGARISMSLRERLYVKIQQLSLSFIQSRRPGELMNRVVSDTNEIRAFMENVFAGMFSTMVTMLGALVIMLAMNWKMTLLSVVFVPVVLVITRIWRKKIHRMFSMQWRKKDKLSNQLQDVISGMRVVKTFGKEIEETQRFDDLASQFYSVMRKNERFWATFWPMLTFLMGCGSYVVVLAGGGAVLGGGLTVGQLTQFMAYAGMLYGPLGWIANLPRSLMRMATCLDRVYDILDETTELYEAETSAEVVVKGHIALDDIVFGYKSYEPVLEHISMEVKKGEMIGLVGPSGAGKSTLINLIMRLYDVDQGKIMVDGKDIKELDPACYHNQMGVVLQETFLFSGTIFNNIRFSKPDATLEEVIAAAKSANAHDFICRLPDGYDTYVGEHGYKISGGERQRIAIARALLNDPKLLILDEATSNLDTESEYQIQRALERLTKGRTTFAIAHRLSTLKNADRLFVIDNHRIIESGTHNELIEKKGMYYRLVKAQLEMAKVAKTKEAAG